MAINIGTPVLVRNRYLAEFKPGFTVAEVTTHGYVVTRNSDGARLPADFTPDDVQVDPQR